MFSLDVGSQFVSWSASACRCFANWACLETVVTARRNLGERRSQWLAFHVTLQVNSFRWCSYMHEESHGRGFRCGASIVLICFNMPWQAYVMCKTSYIVIYIYDKHQDNFKTDSFCHFDFCGSLWTYSPLLHLKFHSESDELVSGFPCAEQSKWTFGTHVDSPERKKPGNQKGRHCSSWGREKNHQDQNHQIQNSIMFWWRGGCYLKLLKGS